MLEFANLTSDLPRITVKDGDEALELLRRETNLIHGQDNVAYCTAQINEQVVNALCELKLRKRNPLLLAVIPPALDSEETKELLKPLKRLDMAQVSYYVLCPSQTPGGDE